MIAARPLCAVCHRNPREPDSARCYDCGPGRLAPTPHRPRPTAPDEGSDR